MTKTAAADRTGYGLDAATFDQGSPVRPENSSDTISPRRATAGGGSTVRGFLVGAALVVVVALGVLTLNRVAREEPVPLPPASSIPPNAAPETPVVTILKDRPPAPPVYRMPKLDLVRVESDGSALVAGTGEPGAMMLVLIDGAETAPNMIGADGSFVTFLALADSDEPQVLSLRMELADGRVVEGEETVLVSRRKDDGSDTVPVASAGSQQSAGVASAAMGVGPDAASGMSAVPVPGAADSGSEASGPLVAAAEMAKDASQPDTLQAADDPAVRGSAPAAGSPMVTPAVLSAGRDGVRVLEPVTGVVIDTLSYDDAGSMQLGGRAEAGSVRLYLDGQAVSDEPVAEDGGWQVTLPELNEGVYDLRADLVDAAGNVTARYEMPVRAEDRATLERMLPENGRSIGVKTVQPGESLWRIAQQRYGKGDLYVRLFEANRGQIRNPDLIYPGQIFTVPQQ